MPKPVVQKQGESVYYDGKKVGFHGMDNNGDTIFVTWKVFHKTEQSYSMTVDVFEQLDEDVEFIYVVDKNTKDVYKYDIDTYRNAEIITMNEQKQYSPWYMSYEGYWEDHAEKIVPDKLL